MSVADQARSATTAPAGAPPQGVPVAAASALVAAAVVLRHLGTKPLWRDEAISASVASRPVTRILSVLPHHDANAGLYYLLLHAWVAVDGRSPAGIRSLSAACLVATAGVAAWAVSRWLGWEVGLACGLLVAVNPFLVYYGQEARPYALAVVLAAVSTVALFGSEGEALPRLYVAATVALVYADLFAVLYVAALAAALVAWYRWQHRPVPAVLRRCWWTVAAATAPLAVVMVVFERGQISWLPPATVQVLETTVTSVTGGQLGVVLFAALAGAALAGWRRDRSVVLALASAAVAPLVALWSVSQLVPAFIDRYVICSVLALLGLAAVGLAVVRDRLGRVAALAILVPLLVVAGQRSARIEAAGWKVDDAPAVVGFIEARDRPGDAVAYAGGGLQILIDTTIGRTAGFPTDVALAPGGQAVLQDDLYPRDVSATVLRSRLTAVPRLWLITDPSDQRYPQGGPFAQLKPLVTATFTPAGTTSFGTIDVTLLVRGT